MLKPTPEELQEARRLGIDPTGLNGVDLREAIKKAKIRAQPPKSGRRPEKGLAHYRQLVKIARDLGVVIVRGTPFAALRTEVELRIGEILESKRIEAGVTIVYGDGAHSDYVGRRARVVHTDVIWNMNLPHIMLHQEGRERPYAYQACPIVLYASVIDE